MLTTRLGWFGAVAYALPILEVWLLTRLSDRGATVLLVALQVLWVLAFLAVLDRCVRGSRAYRAGAAQRAEDAAAEARREAAEREPIVAATARAEAFLRDVHHAAEAVPQRRAVRPRSLRSSAERRRSHR
jgi:hypothetical protein